MAQPTAREKKYILKVITLSTDSGPALDNWLYGTQRLGYDVTVLGVGEKWVNWAWRTKKYEEVVRGLPESTPEQTTLVLIVDGNDILFVRGPKSLYRAYKMVCKSSININTNTSSSKKSDNKKDTNDKREELLIFGGEPTCCVGKFSAIRINGERQRAMTVIDSRKPKNRWKFPNAGCIMGTRETVLRALTGIRDEPDDQAGHLEKYLEDPKYLNIDWNHNIVGNINRPSLFYCVDCGISDDKDIFELQFWEKVDVNKLKEDLIKNAKDATLYSDCIGDILYRNKTTGGIPCILHFPGKNIRSYNLLGAMLYGTKFRPIQLDTPPSVGKAALFSIAKWWK